MKNLQAMLEEAIRSGKTVEDLYGMANAAQNTVIAEQEKESKIAAVRKKAAEAMCEYINMLEPNGKMSAEEAYQLIEELEDMYDVAFRKTTCSTQPVEPVVRAYTADGYKEIDFNTFIEKLGF